MSRLDWGDFLTSDRWIPNPAGDNPASYGALALIIGSFSTTLIGLALAVPFGLGSAVYISEFAGGRIKEILKVVIELLAAVPSIVWGFIGLMVMGPMVVNLFSTDPETSYLARSLIYFHASPETMDIWLTRWGKVLVTLHLAADESGAVMGTNLLTGGIILGLMSVPLIVSLSEDALRAVPDTFREAALALGANNWEIVRRVLFPAGRSGLLAACLLGMGRAVGETMAVLMATGHSNRIPHALTDPVRTMTAAIAAEMGEVENGSDHYRVLFILGIVLFVITCSINLVSDLIIKGMKRRYRT
jgi:phosphate transport system permease protein